MLFNSFEFLLFFPIVTILFFLLPHKFRWFHLLMASVLFYMAFLPIYVLILVITIIIDYVAGIYIEKSTGRRRKQYLILSIIANVGFLALFKYYDFIIVNINSLLTLHLPLLKDLWLSTVVIKWNNAINFSLNGMLGTNLRIIETIILPIGLSFHTFQAMSYTIEVYRGRQKAEKHFGIYALYVMFYPQLVAGPIERPQNVIHQFHEKKTFSYENLIVGLRLMAWGLFKKVVIADRLSIYVGAVYAAPMHYHWLNIVIATLFFGIQIYCDFSGYSDMAIGIAKTMGYKLMVNFNRPYFATNIQEFWAKWHISLSTWFRDFFYIPLGGNRVKFYRYLLNVSLVFIVSGIWHGASWNFAAWGCLHAAYLVVFILFTKYFGKFYNKDSKAAKFIGWGLTMFFVFFAWIFFRASDITQAFQIIHQICYFVKPELFQQILLSGEGQPIFGIFSIGIIVLALAYMILIEKKYQPKLKEFNNQFFKDIAFFSFTIILILIFGLFVKESFIYFQF